MRPGRETVRRPRPVVVRLGHAGRAHVDSELMVEMAQACRGILTEAPEIDLLEGISAHDLN